MSNYSKSIHGWGKHPIIQSRVLPFSINSLDGIERQRIAFGNNKSYGDSALNQIMIDMKQYRFMLDFDASKGILKAQAGVLLADIINTFVPRGWFPSVVPGTQFITLGGAIASDVHGKNHHLKGCFSESVKNVSLLMPSGEILSINRENNQELFFATCGGMGLTGIILDAEIQLERINGHSIEQTTHRIQNLETLLDAFELHHNAHFSVAWVDCLAKGSSLGRSLLSIGQFYTNALADYQPISQHIVIPDQFPSFALNPWSIKLFNSLHYHYKSTKTQPISLDKFFFPLDAIKNWNNLYGKNGLQQYQCIIPKKNGYPTLKKILTLISQYKKGSFLAVIKSHGKSNQNYLSFPMEGYSLAIDLKNTPSLNYFLQKLDDLVLENEGRLYLAKDARMTESFFKQSYPQWHKFYEIRKKYKLTEHINSLQSNRLGI